MKGKNISKTLTLLTSFILLIVCISSEVFAQSTEQETLASESTIYFESKNSPLPKSSSKIVIPNVDIAWVKLTMSDNLKNATVTTEINGNLYEFQVDGYSEKCKNGHIGLYQGYVIPSPYDNELKKLSTDENGVVATIDTSSYEDNMFFTISLGVVSETQNPVIKHFGTYTDEINTINQKLYEASQKNITQYETNDLSSLETSCNSTRVLAAATYQTSGIIYDSSSRIVGRISLFHADELENQNSMKTYVKINSNCSGANAYAKDYWNLTSGYSVSALPTKIWMSLQSNSGNLAITVNGYQPQSNITQVNLAIPYFINGNFGTLSIPYTLSSTTAKTYGSIDPYQNIDWTINQSSGLGGIDGSYSTKTGLSGYAQYQYAGNITSSTTAKLTAKGYIVYTVFVENNTSGITSRYSFTTSTISRSSNVSILP